MFWNTRQVSVWVYAQPVDMRKSFDGLCAVVTERLGRDPLSGDLFVFVGRNRKRAKVLHWDGTGLCVWTKRLEQGSFTAPWRLPRGEVVRMTLAELQLLLEGTELVGRYPLSPPSYVLGGASPRLTADGVFGNIYK
jgi:transposase